MIRSLMGKAAVVSFALVAATTVAQAQTSGTVSFTGGVQVTSSNNAGAPAPGGCCVLLDFLTAGSAGLPTGTWTVLGESNGFFTPLADGMTGSVSDLNIGGSDVNLNGDTFLQIGGYTFSNPVFVMANATAPGSIAAGQILLESYAGGTRATLGVNGTVTGPGIAGPANFFGILTTQFTRLPAQGAFGEILAPTPAQLYEYVNAGNVLRTSVSSEFSATIVPEPSTYALMGLGLAGMAVFARRRRLV